MASVPCFGGTRDGCYYGWRILHDYDLSAMHPLLALGMVAAAEGAIQSNNPITNNRFLPPDHYAEAHFATRLKPLRMV